MDWRALEARVDATMLVAFGEPIRLSPMKNGAADNTRLQWIGRALLQTGGDDSISVGDGMRTRLSAGKAELMLDRGTYTGPDPKAGDVVRAIDRVGVPAWRIADVSDRYTSLIVLSLNQV